MAQGAAESMPRGWDHKWKHPQITSLSHINVMQIQKRNRQFGSSHPCITDRLAQTIKGADLADRPSGGNQLK